MNLYRRIFIKLFILTALCITFTYSHSAADASIIKDMDQCAPYSKEAIIKLADMKIIEGDQNRNFKPKENITRAQVVSLIVKAMSLDISSKPESPTFRDVPPEHWAYGYVEAAYKEGIINGISKDEFGVNQLCTREQAATMFVNAFKMTPDAINKMGGGKDTLKAFDDSEDISFWAGEQVALAFAEGLMFGTGKEQFSPKMAATNEQFAVITGRFLDKMEEQLLDNVFENLTITADTNSFTISKSVGTVPVGVSTITDSKGHVIYINLSPRGFGDHYIVDADGNRLDRDLRYFYIDEDRDYMLEPRTNDEIYRMTYVQDEHDKLLFNLDEEYTLRVYAVIEKPEWKVVRRNITIKPSAKGSHIIESVLPMGANNIAVRFEDMSILDEQSILDTENYEVVDSKGNILSIKEIKTSDFKDTIILLLDKSFDGPEKAKVTINDIEPGFTYDKTVYFNDVSPPGVLKMSAEGYGTERIHVEITFTEYVKAADIIVNNKYVGRFSGNTVSFTTKTPDYNGGSWQSIQILNMTDGRYVNPYFAADYVSSYYAYHKDYKVNDYDEYTVIKSISYTKDDKGRVDYLIFNLKRPIKPEYYKTPFGLAIEPDLNSITVFDENYQWLYNTKLSSVRTESGEILYHPGPKYFTRTWPPIFVKEGDTSIFIPVAESIDIYQGKHTVVIHSTFNKNISDPMNLDPIEGQLPRTANNKPLVVEVDFTN